MVDERGARGSAAARGALASGVLFVEQGGRGGVADYTSFLADALAQRGIPVTVATAEDHRYQTAPGVEIVPIFAYVRGHSRATRIARRAGLGKLLNGVRFMLAMPALFKLARGRAVAHVQGWERTSLGLIATLLLRATGTRVVYTAHNTFERNAFAIDGARVFPALAQATIVHTSRDLARLTRPATVIPHGNYLGLADSAPEVDPETARRSLGLAADAFVVLLFGHLRPDKGIGELLEALPLAPGWHALIAGEEDGGLAEATALLATPELAGRVTVQEGFHEMPAVGRFFAACDLVALPYKLVSQSGVLHLAYGFRRPIVGYPAGGLSEAVLDGETGWICREATPASLAETLERAAVLGHDRLRAVGERGRQYSEERFGWSRIAEATEAVYLTVLEPGSVTTADAEE